MPLTCLVPSLSRLRNTELSDSVVHSLHEYLTPLLQTTRSVSQKYQSILPDILRNGGGEGEIEETMMWFALNHEKATDELWEKTENGPWEDDKWRKEWIERMERKEYVRYCGSNSYLTANRVQIQILMYLLKLSLLGPQPVSPSKKRKRVAESEQIRQEEEQALEGFFDRMSMWQLMSDMETSQVNPVNGLDKEHDWIQKFFLNTVLPQSVISLRLRIHVWNLTSLI
jgi:hypothetical protein